MIVTSKEIRKTASNIVLTEATAPAVSFDRSVLLNITTLPAWSPVAMYRPVLSKLRAETVSAVCSTDSKEKQTKQLDIARSRKGLLPHKHKQA
jgi:hypothetical protein